MRQIQKVVSLTLFPLLLTFILFGCGSTSTSDLADDNSTIIETMDDNTTITGTDDNATVTGTDDNATITGTDDNATVTGTDDNATITGTDDNATITGTDDNATITGTDDIITISGQVIDGEIAGAVVFLDLDKDSEFDSTEPNTLTKADGTYTLVLSIENQKHENYLNQTAPLVAYGGKDIRTDEVFEDYLMSILEGKDYVNITPFTTLIAQSLEEEISTETSKSFRKTDPSTLTALAERIAEIKKNLAELFGLDESILDKNPIQLAKEGDNSLLSQSLQLHKSAKAMKKAMKEDARDLKKSILKSYRSLGRELKKLKKDALKNQDEALLEALDTAMDDSQLFESNLVAEVKAETKKIVVSINEFWKGQEGTLTDNALSDAIQEGESTLDTAIGTDTGTEDSTDAGTETGTEDGTDAGTETGTEDGTDAGTDTGTGTGAGTDTGTGDSTGTGQELIQVQEMAQEREQEPIQVQEMAQERDQE